jgi:hypothetical protein
MKRHYYDIQEDHRLLRMMADEQPILGLQVTGYRLQVTGCRLQVTGYRLQVAGYRLQVSGYRLQVANLPTWNMKHETTKY